MDNKNSYSRNDRSKLAKILLIVLVAILGVGGGAAGALLMKPYLVENLYSPFGQDINLTQDNLRRASLIIDNAKKIVVEQDNKVGETINSAQNILVGIFNKKEKKAADPSGKFDLSGYYGLDQAVGGGLIVTSDGWVLANDFAKDQTEDYIVKNYVVITRNKDVYSIDRAMSAGVDSYWFVHLSGAKELPVKGFVSKDNLNNSQLLVVVNWRGESYLSNVVAKRRPSEDSRSSEAIGSNIILSGDLKENLDSAFVFNLNGEVAGFFDKRTGVVPADNFQSTIKGLLEKKERKQPELGVNYVALSDFAIKDVRYEKGALLLTSGKVPAVKEKSAAALSGLAAGDIIVGIDNISIDANNDLADVLRKYSAGDEVNIVYLRGGEEKTVKVKLGELAESKK